jgi:hypothetical protein
MRVLLVTWTAPATCRLSGAGARPPFRRGDVICILAISGSLRAASSNSTARAAMDARAGGCRGRGLRPPGDLPHFNPDVDDAGAPPRSRISACSPRRPTPCSSRARVRTACLACWKDASDLVGTGEFVDKLTALVDAVARVGARLADETLTVMMARIVPEAAVDPRPARSWTTLAWRLNPRSRADVGHAGGAGACRRSRSGGRE